MTMLQQILKDMFIDPELLAELSDDQKQVLFCKMREEQVKKWGELDEAREKDERHKPKKPPKPSRKRLRVNFLMGTDGNPWTWVMGEHVSDRTIEQILESEEHRKASEQAEQETEALRCKQDEETARKLREEQDALKKMEEAENLKKQEAAMYQSLKEAQLEAQQLEHQKQIEEKQKLEEIKCKVEVERRKSEERIKQIKEKRSSEIYLSFRESRKRFDRVAEENSSKVEEEWKEQEKKAKEAEAMIRAVARRAREEHRRSYILNAEINIGKSTTDNQPAVPTKSTNNNKVRPPRPLTRQAVIEWYKEEEIPRKSGFNEDGDIAPWFHGIITRIEAERILDSAIVGTFLVRVSERVWGYTISYKDQGRCKHFLVDTSGGSFQFFGTCQVSHKTLLDLIKFHFNTPISIAGNEILMHSCGQTKSTPDYHDLIDSQITAL